MFSLREAKLSMHRDLKDMFEDTTIWGTTPFTIYGIEEMKDTSPNPALANVRVFLLMNRMLVPITRSPTIIIDARFRTRPFELGSVPGGYCDFAWHVFGRTNGEADDLTGAIMKHITVIHLRDFDVAAQTLLDTVELLPIQGDDYWVMEPQDIGDNAAKEGTLRNWNTLLGRFPFDI